MNIRVQEDWAVDGIGYAPTEYDFVGGHIECLRLYFQGCLHKCEHCANPHSQLVNGGIKTDTEKIKKCIADSGFKKIIFTGGEPFLQPAAALDIAQFAHSKGMTVVCNTGYSKEQIAEWHDNRELLAKEIDDLVTPCVFQLNDWEAAYNGSN